MRALIIDVSKSMTVLLNQHLSGLHLTTEVHTSGNRALESLKTQPVDLICIAMQLTDMDALKFCSRLRRDQQICDPHIVLLTTSEDRQLLSQATKHGVNEIFKKEDISDLLDYLVDWSQTIRLNLHEGEVLVVKQTVEEAEWIGQALETFGYTHDLETSAIEAMKRLQIKSYDLIISDFVLNGKISGLEFIQTIRRKYNNPLELPILLLTQTTDNKKKLEIMHSGANDFLIQSNDPGELWIRANNLIRTKRLFDQVNYQHKKLQDLAMTDQLTGLYNRHYLFEVGPQSISDATRHNFPVSLLLIDLDKFKVVNDTYGHAIGDEVLSATGKLLKSQCRNGDTVARFGGEEFVIVLPYCPLAEAIKKAELIRIALFELKPSGLTVSASFGVAEFDREIDSDFNAVFTRADEAVYSAKESGRNCVCGRYAQAEKTPQLKQSK